MEGHRYVIKRIFMGELTVSRDIVKKRLLIREMVVFLHVAMTSASLLLYESEMLAQKFHVQVYFLKKSMRVNYTPQLLNILSV